MVADLSPAQVTWGKQSLRRGKLWATVWNSLQYGDPTETQNGFFTLDYPGYSKGTDVTDALNYAEAGGYAIYGVRAGTASSYTINSRFFPSGQSVNSGQIAQCGSGSVQVAAPWCDRYT